jgi:hypothetical protein
MQSTLTKPYEYALELADLKIDDKIVTLPIKDGVLQIGEGNDIVLTAKTVISTDYTEGTLTYHDALSIKSLVLPLDKLGIPSIEAGDEWDPTVCSVTLKHAAKLVRDKMGARKPKTESRQFMGLNGPIKPGWEK